MAPELPRSLCGTHRAGGLGFGAVEDGGVEGLGAGRWTREGVLKVGCATVTWEPVGKVMFSIACSLVCPFYSKGFSKKKQKFKINLKDKNAISTYLL